MRRFLTTLLVLGACAPGGPQQVGAEPSWRGGAARVVAAAPVTFAPVGEPVARYNEPVGAAPQDPLHDIVVAAVRDAATRAGVRQPVPDARLSRACAELAAVTPAEGFVDYRLVEFALQRNGIIEPSPRMLVGWSQVDAPDQFVQQLRPQLEDYLREGATIRFGVGAARRNADGTGVVVFAVQSSALSTAPIPRQVSAGGAAVLDVVVDARYRDPEVFVTREDGATQQLELELQRARPGGFIARVPCASHHGRQQIEIAASDAMGSTVLANFPVWCDAAPPTAITIDDRDDPPAANAEDAERRLFASVNHDRVAAGLAALEWDDALAGVARRYSEEMHRTRVVAHVSPISGSVGDRVRAAGIKVPLMLENIARAYGVNGAHQGLMSSPGHRSNLLSSAATRIGIGVVFGDEASGRRELFITQVFTRVPPKLDHDRALDSLRTKLVAVRAGLGYNAALSEVAQDAASALATGRSREATSEAVKQRVAHLGARYQRLGSVITAVSDLDGLDGAGLLGDMRGDALGLGIAQGPHPELGDQAIWIVLLLAVR